MTAPVLCETIWYAYTRWGWDAERGEMYVTYHEDSATPTAPSEITLERLAERVVTS